MTGGASLLSGASSGDNSKSVALLCGLALGFASDFASEGLPSGLALASFLSLFLSEDLLSDSFAAGSWIATRSLSPSMTTMASAFSVARLLLAAAAQSAGSPSG